MKLEKKNLIVERPYKSVYKTEEGVVKIFVTDHPKSAVFNEALNTVKVEETGLDIPKLKEVTQINGEWALVIENREGKTLEEMMKIDRANLEKYMSDFVDLQLKVQSKTAETLPKLKDKLANKIRNLKVLDATERYELLTRLESMPRHTKLCHGDFNPSNVIVEKNGKMTVIDWAHASQGNASADAAMTYLLFALKDQKVFHIFFQILPIRFHHVLKCLTCFVLDRNCPLSINLSYFFYLRNVQTCLFYSCSIQSLIKYI